MKDYKKSSNQRRNEWIRSRIPKPIEPHLRLEVWVSLPVNPNNNKRGNLDCEPQVEVKLRKFEAEHTNNFLILNNQEIRYERKGDWLKNKWEKKLKE